MAVGNGCWECISHTLDKGYPIVNRHKKKHRMSRYVYELYYGEAPINMVVMHSCDNPKCINPKHLSLGTNKDNTQDMLNKNRGNKGKRSYNTNLSKDQLLEIKQMLINKVNGKYIAEKFNVAPGTISNIKKGKILSYSEILGGDLNDWMVEKPVQEEE